jgi:site-specific recombinase XerC
MINRQNWQLTKKYLDYRQHVDQISLPSVDKEITHLRYLLEWSQDKPFSKALNVRPTFPEYLAKSRLDGRKGQLSPVYIKKILSTVRMFFDWYSDNVDRNIKQSFIKSLRVKRISTIPKVRDVVSLDEILAISKAPVLNIEERRARASLVFLYLSGMRIGAFVSLPMKLIDLDNRSVMQYPSLGVRTKNSKHSITYLLDIPELLSVVRAWCAELAFLDFDVFYFPLFSPAGGFSSDPVIGKHRANLARRNFKDWLDRVGLPYHSPHKFRHGHVHYGLQRSKDMADFKAVSLNVMHSSVKTTDEFYSILPGDEVQRRISDLDKK